MNPASTSKSGLPTSTSVAAIPGQSKTAFDELQLELSLEINEAMTTTGRKLLENFDDEVREKLRIRDESARAFLNRFERLLMHVTAHELIGHAEFLGDSSFRLRSIPFHPKEGEIPLGLYELPRRSDKSHLYRLNHPLAEALLERPKRVNSPRQDHVRLQRTHRKGSLLRTVSGEIWLVEPVMPLGRSA